MSRPDVCRALAVAWLALAGACDLDEEPCEDQACPDVWQLGPRMPGRRLEPAVAAMGTRLVVAGGFSTSAQEGLEITREVLVLDTFQGTWSNLPDAPVAWTHGNLASSGATLYLLGGLEGPDFVARGEAWALDLGADAWRPLPPMPAGLERGAAAVVIAPPRIYLLGGASTTGAVATNLVFDYLLLEWTQLPDLPLPRSHAAAMRQDDATLIVAGGLAGLGSALPLRETLRLPQGADRWELREEMPTARGGCAYGVALGELICAGGEAGSSVVAAVEGYDPRVDRWFRYPDMPSPRAGTQGAAIGQQLYVPGGANRLVFDPTDTLWVFDAPAAVAATEP